MLKYEVFGQSLTCHSPKATKANADSRRKAQVRETVLDLAAQMGRSDGTTWAMCSFCGVPALHDGIFADTNNPASLTLAHVVADVFGSPYCPCNLVPAHYGCQAPFGTETVTESVELAYDTRDLWTGLLLPKPRNRSDFRLPVWGAAAWSARSPQAHRLQGRALDRDMACKGF